MSNRLELDTFALPAPETLIHSVVQELICLAIGGLETEGNTPPSLVTSFITDVLRCLGECHTLRFNHRQMVLLLQNFLRASKDVAVMAAGLDFAIISARRDASYATWLYDVTTNATTETVGEVSLEKV